MQKNINSNSVFVQQYCKNSLYKYLLQNVENKNVLNFNIVNNTNNYIMNNRFFNISFVQNSNKLEKKSKNNKEKLSLKDNKNSLNIINVFTKLCNTEKINYSYMENNNTLKTNIKCIEYYLKSYPNIINTLVNFYKDISKSVNINIFYKINSKTIFSNPEILKRIFKENINKYVLDYRNFLEKNNDKYYLKNIEIFTNNYNNSLISNISLDNKKQIIHFKMYTNSSKNLNKINVKSKLFNVKLIKIPKPKQFSINELIKRAESKKNIPSGLLRAIGLVESRLQPYCVNYNGRGYFFKTESEAVKFINNLIKNGENNFSVGCFQIHYKSHATKFRSIKEMLDPARNIEYAANLLEHLYKSYDYRWANAVQKYNAHDSYYYNKIMRKLGRFI